MAADLHRLYAQAGQLHAQGRLGEAERLYAKILAVRPRDAAALHMLGLVYGQQGRIGEALSKIEAALAVDGRALSAWLDRAALLYAQDRVDEALACYDHVRAKWPGDVNALYARAQLLFEIGRLDLALADYQELAASCPRDAAVLCDLANLLLALGRPDEALAFAERTLALDPGSLEGLNNRGNILARLGRFEEAVASYDAALARAPKLPETLTNRGLALSQLGRLEDALASYDAALALAPDLATGWSNRALTLRALNRLEDAIESAGQALTLAPADADALNTLGKALCESGRIVDGFAASTLAAAITHDVRAAAPSEEGSYRARHDAEQRRYLAEEGLPTDGFHLTGGRRLAGPAVDPANARPVAAAWRAADPKTVVIDQFLTPEALDGLRRFCWGSTIWSADYAGGYIGAFPETGLACPLLAQIAEELRAAFPDIFGEHALRYVWAFKYDSRGGGTRVHADEAAVNVNFWITPDEANLDPERGGLVFWDKAAPSAWSYAQFNEDSEALEAFLAQSGARAEVVPYRANRAVIFDSALFHATDAFRFRDGYRDRRINITMLFGRRQTA